MQRRFARTLLLVAPILLAAALAVGALAQSEEDKSRFVSFLEKLLSTPDRKVTLTGLEGVFSWHPTVEKIAVADRDGVWLELEGVEVAWTRSALFNRTLDIQVLRASTVTMFRRPVSGEQSSRSGGISAPPLQIEIDSIALPKVVLDEAVAGAAAELSAAGSASLTLDALALKLTVDRQDRAGLLSADLRYEPAENVLVADVKVEEPTDGLIADLLRLRGRPALSASLSGNGQLNAWQAQLDVEADSSRVISGAMSITRSGPTHRVVAKMAAALETLVPEDFSNLVAGESRVDLDLFRAADGSIALSAATLKSEGLDFAAKGIFGRDLVPQSAELTVKLGQAGRAELPLIPGEVSVATMDVAARLEAGAAAPWRVEATLSGLEGTFGQIAELDIDASGQAENLTRADSRSIGFSVDGSADGVSLTDARLRDAVGSSLKINGAGSWTAGQAVAVNNLLLTAPGASVTLAGTVEGDAFDGTLAASVSDLSRFAAVAGRALAGGIDVQARGSVAVSGIFDLTLDGTATKLAVGIPTLDPILAATTRIEGGVARTEQGFGFNALKLTNERASVAVTGSLSDPELTLDVTATLADLALVTPRASGSATVSAKLSGSRDAPMVEAEVSGENVVLMGRPLADAHARFAGVVSGPQTAGDAEITGTLGETPISGAAKLSAGAGGARTLEDLVLSVGESRASGALVVGTDGLLVGQLKIVSPDLSKVAPLFLTQASGMVRAEVQLAAEQGAQAAVFSGTVTDIVYESVTLESADVSVSVRDLFRAPMIEGEFSVRTLHAGGLAILAATGTAARQGNATNVSVDARLADGSAKLAGSLTPQDGGLAIALQSFAYSRTGVEVALAAPTTITVTDGIASFDNAALRTGSGRVVVNGRAGSMLDLSATLTSLPAALANSFIANLGAEGTISGTVTATGSAAAPAANFDLALAAASVAASRNAGLGAVGVTAKGSLANKVVNLTTRVSGADGLAIDVAGTVGATANGALNLRVTGSAPLSLGNRQLASRGAALQGALQLDMTVAGTTSAPRYSGRITSSGGGFVDPDTGIVLRDLVLAASLSADRVVIEQLTANSGDGNIVAMGSVGLDPRAGFPVELAVQVRKARYVDGTLIATRFDADLKLSGTMSTGPLLQGAVFLDRTEITVPDRLPRDSVAVDVRHVDAPAAVEATLAAVRGPETNTGGGQSSSGMRLDVSVSAPQRIFVRGRGLDAELGGNLRLVGSMSALSASGAFQLVRGRLDMLTQRIVFDRGDVTFAGDLDPILDFSGSTKSGDTTITVTVSGRASDPAVTFSSVPQLPQDEILARLVFNKGVGELSPLQVARLAAAVSELSGGSGGILSRLRASTGLDDLDIVTDAEGNTSVAAGRYVTENVYLGVQQGATANSSRVIIDLDVTKDIKARAGMGGEEGSSLGIYFEREY